MGQMVGNPKVTVIPARPRMGIGRKNDERQKIRVAAYCRVSTDSDEQATSYEAQIEHYTAFIKKNPDWEFAGIFADDGISGTDTRKREEFNRMIEECMKGKIQMVITKSISRFARNTLDCLKYIRQLKDRGIPVFFEKENINTMDAKGEVMLTIMASLAQQESESLSQNVKIGLQYRYQQGLVQVNHNRFLGYTKDAEGHLVIKPEEAEVVKRIYREYLEGASLLQIGKGLEADGIDTNLDYYFPSYVFGFSKDTAQLWDLVNRELATVNGSVNVIYVDDRAEHVLSAARIGWKGIRYYNLEQLKKQLDLLLEKL